MQEDFFLILASLLVLRVEFFNSELVKFLQVDFFSYLQVEFFIPYHFLNYPWELFNSNRAGEEEQQQAQGFSHNNNRVLYIDAV